MLDNGKMGSKAVTDMKSGVTIQNTKVNTKMEGKKASGFLNGLTNQLTQESGFKIRYMAVALISGQTKEYISVRVLME